MLAPTTCRSKSWTSKASRADRNRAPRTHSTRTLRNSPVLTRWASASWSKTDLGLDGIDGPQHPDPTVLGELMAIDEDSEEPATDLEAPGQQPLAALDGPMGWCRAIVTPPPSPPTRRRSSSKASRADRNTAPRTRSAHTLRNSPVLKRWASGMQRRPGMVPIPVFSLFLAIFFQVVLQYTVSRLLLGSARLQLGFYLSALATRP